MVIVQGTEVLGFSTPPHSVTPEKGVPQVRWILAAEATLKELTVRGCLLVSHVPLGWVLPWLERCAPTSTAPPHCKVGMVELGQFTHVIIRTR